MQQISNAMRGEQEVEMADNPEEFWENPTIMIKVFSILEKATTADTLLYGIGLQRPGFVENMTIGEFEGRQDKKGRNKFVITVFKHKTSSTGPANIVMSKQYEKVMCQYWAS